MFIFFFFSNNIMQNIVYIYMIIFLSLQVHINSNGMVFSILLLFLTVIILVSKH